MTERNHCQAVGALVVGGRHVGWLRCSLYPGHEKPSKAWSGLTVPATPHRAVLEWVDEAVQLADWPEAYDAAERFDVDVELVPAPDDREG